MNNTLRTLLLIGFAAALAACTAAEPSAPAGSPPADATTAVVAQTDAPAAAALPLPACERPTAPNALGPYYTPNTPERASLLEPGTEGERLVITGYVLDAACEPIPGAWLDFWQADANGKYDNSGYTLRGHQFTDATGRYTLETVLPGRYPGRTRHIHVAAQAPGGEPFVTQIYFPDEPANDRDGLYLPELELSYQTPGDLGSAVFHFILDTP